ncbi:MAG TPA: methyltransferase domain-containing protein [Candidatus Polarisedimenticolaceae bacterium]|nr:methyltransferase domain-containing protein [Candidatus Polarisedimenticolaceae bacterium]
MSLELRCTVRDCGLPLAREGSRLVCASKHTFDRAREGYWNLLQPQDKRSAAAGDRDQATDARRRFIGRGFADGLVEVLREIVAPAGVLPQDALDVGCGEGSLTAKLFKGASSVCGVDLSRRAVTLAARKEPRFTWLVANADRALPLADRSIPLAVSIFGRRPAAELSRIIAPGGLLVVVLPGADDLAELRRTSQGEAAGRDRVVGALAALHPAFALKRQLRWRHAARLDRAALLDAAVMSYRGVRKRERDRLALLKELDVTLSAEILELTSCS